MVLVCALVVGCGAGAPPSPTPDPWPTGQVLVDKLKTEFGYELKVDPSEGGQSWNDGAGTFLIVREPLSGQARVTMFLITDEGLSSRHLARIAGLVTPGAVSWIVQADAKANGWEGTQLRQTQANPGGTLVIDASKPDFLAGIIFTVMWVPTGMAIPTPDPE